MPRKDRDTPQAKEDMFDLLLSRIRAHATRHDEVLWEDMVSVGKQTRKFFLSLPEEEKRFLLSCATAEAFLSA